MTNRNFTLDAYIQAKDAETFKKKLPEGAVIVEDKINPDMLRNWYIKVEYKNGLTLGKTRDVFDLLFDLEADFNISSEAKSD